jgi:ABC-type branched-subunit amino acid transport system substrate-binding protein
MKRKRLVVSIAMFLVTLLIAGVVACGDGTTTSTTAAPTTTVSLPEKTLDIGIASALTGDAADLGTQLHNGALLAIEEQNAKGGITIAGEKYALNPIEVDTASAVDKGKLAGEQLIYDKKVKIIVGPCIGDAYGIQPVVEANKVLTVMMQPIVDSMEGPDKPYTFFSAGPLSSTTTQSRISLSSTQTRRRWCR